MEHIGGFFQADSLAYLSHDGMMEVARQEGQGYCSACFTGDYPVHAPWREDLHQLALFDKQGF